ncbi:hypothetical protein [Calothrix sp. PCC 6303]|uniref:hypothetical protein n=1 Tax=Calothrix sp. PCC 6303 TaxID=1170562 RepID=UPI0002A0260B|nr:hypothetical protein [Calothrix sp. PCC 6303]AFY99530.1 hypothetical protein Cal6303_0453 [Calothrix sp. PCC 6303]
MDKKVSLFNWKLDGGILHYRANLNSSWKPVIWDEQANTLMEGQHMGGTSMENGRFMLVVIGGDSKLLWRIGEPSPYFAPDGIKSLEKNEDQNAGKFFWNNGTTMEAKSITSVVLLDDGKVTITIVGGDGTGLYSQQERPNSTNFTKWQKF